MIFDKEKALYSRTTRELRFFIHSYKVAKLQKTKLDNNN
jgi:hypothetical protein